MRDFDVTIEARRLLDTIEYEKIPREHWDQVQEVLDTCNTQAEQRDKEQTVDDELLHRRFTV